MKTKTALYAGSFDPITVGHLWVIHEASKMFDTVQVVIGHNPGKLYMFPIDQRAFMVFDAIKEAGIQNASVSVMDNNVFLAKYARERGINHVIRGIRNTADFEFEKTMRNFNENINKNLTTVFLIPPADVADVSSSIVKSMIGPDGWEDVVKQLVPTKTFTNLQQLHSLRTQQS